MNRSRNLVGLMVLAVFSLCSATAFASTRVVAKTSSPNAAVLPDNGCVDDTNGTGLGGITDTINYSPEVGGIISDVNVRVEFTQTWRSDIQASLTLDDGSPNTVILINNFDTSGDNLFAILDDEGVGLCSSVTHCGTGTNCVTAPGPTCQPNQALSAFDGQTIAAPANFILTVCDRAAADNGNLVAWEITVDGSAPLPVELQGFSVEN